MKLATDVGRPDMTTWTWTWTEVIKADDQKTDVEETTAHVMSTKDS